MVISTNGIDMVINAATNCYELSCVLVNKDDVVFVKPNSITKNYKLNLNKLN